MSEIRYEVSLLVRYVSVVNVSVSDLPSVAIKTNKKTN